MRTGNSITAVIPVLSSVSVFQEEPGDLSGVPEDLCSVVHGLLLSIPIDRMIAASTLYRVACLLVVD